MVVIIHRIPN